ncbi:membrane protein [Methylogaea oryzae]|uniref:Membrane protein n=2 Tax=Methylogaea oryzae TaxID=1295382 RepID=A0A8D5AP57_9GAMM|nr:membrane protein [Methylogaea oryzae]
MPHAIRRITLSLALLLLWGNDAGAFDWSSTELQYLHGSGYRFPGNGRDVDRSIFTVSHADGYALGRNFFFLDTLITESGEASQINLYGEAYTYLSLSKLSGADLNYGILKDLDIAAGVNLGENTNSTKSGPRVILYGAAVELNLPGFSLFTVDILRHDQLEPVFAGSSWQFTPVWKFPFTAFGAKWTLEGFTDFITGKNKGYVRQVLSQPQLRLDVGDQWGHPDKLYVGIEYQYWHNKYGIKGLSESLPQALIVWKF